MSNVAFDTLHYAQLMQEAGFSQKQAVKLAEAQKIAFTEAIDVNLATRQDVLNVEVRLNEKIAGLNEKIAELNEKIADVKMELKDGMATMRHEMIKWIIGLFVSQLGLTIGIMFGVMKLLH